MLVNAYTMTVLPGPGEVSGDPVMRDVGGVMVTEIVPRPATIDELRTAAKERLAEERWHRETGGITWGGHAIQTDRDSRSIMVQAAVLGWPDGGAWKCADGSFTAIAAADFTLMVAAVQTHVRTCFDREAVLVAAIDAAATVADVGAIDITAGWGPA